MTRTAPSQDLPRDAQSILALAGRSMFEALGSASEGMLLVNREGVVIWINDQYRRFLPALGFPREEDSVGQPVSRVVQNTQMHKVLESGRPILIDLLVNRAGTFVVSRIPLRDAAGLVIGALGIVLFDQLETNLQPLIAKFSLLQRDLDDARRELAAQRRLPGLAQRQAKHTFASFVGSSVAAVEVKRQARRAAQSSSPVLLLGETGTGKELLAHAIHGASARAGGPLVSVNIAAVPDNLLEAEFFGVAAGAYTGAERKGREGKFRLANGGTLLLDEIGDMPLAVQAKLLRALQEGEIEPLGSNRLIPFDARIIAATSRDLHAMVRAGQFREDLYYRLNVLPIHVPALRERRSDIGALVEVLCADMAAREGLQPPDVLPDAMAVLTAQEWPGNVRQLRNVLEQLALRSDGEAVDAAQVQSVLQASGVAPVAPAAMPALGDAARAQALLRPLEQQVAELEQRAIAAALHATGGNKAAVAKMLGMARATLYQRLGQASKNHTND